MVHIPEQLVELVNDRRVIPFVGAGLSAALGMPDWAYLLRLLADDHAKELTYEDLSRHAGGDHLRIAEYLYLKCDSRIGPIRHALERALPTKDPVLSGAHVELANLGAQQVYTTNYDSLIEDTYRALELPYSVVALPKDVASVDSDRTQIVKYHGDLQHEETLVLTESSYYRRLDFESPMDLKFRSDLLGKSVLYMGYSFSDINIRLVWFKLMEMMKDIPERDRLPSFIVRLTPNPVLEELYRDVGLHTVVLMPDPGGPPDSEVSGDEASRRLAAFLRDLASAAFPDSLLPRTEDPLFYSASLSDQMRPMPGEASRRRLRASAGIQSPLVSTGVFVSPGVVRQLAVRRIPTGLEDEALRSLVAAIESIPRHVERFADDVLVQILGRPWDLMTEADPRLTAAIMGLLLDPYRRERVRTAAIEWEKVWSAQLPADVLKSTINRSSRELEFHGDDPPPDLDLAWCAAILVHIANGHLGASQELEEEAGSVLERISDMYPSASTLRSELDSAPDPTPLIAELQDLMVEVDANEADLEDDG